VIEERKLDLKDVQKNKELSKNDQVEGQRRSLAFIDLLLLAQMEGTQFMTDKDIRDEVSTFMFEGHDTVTTATCWTLFMMGTYPEIQQKVAEELKQVFGDSDRAPTMKDLAELKCLERCIKETLRLYPSVPFFERNTLEDANLGGMQILTAASLFLAK
jgi:cytochrome P450